jgi:phospholipid/cholesterol/gamma-HCH transport system substrate-binding protein
MIKEAPPSPTERIVRIPEARLPRPGLWKRIPVLVKGPVVIGLALLAIYLGIKAAYGGFGHYYYLSVDLPRAGQQLAAGDDVRLRGVVIGKIDSVRLVERRVRMTLQIRQQYHIPSSAEAVVSLKTLLGAKFLDLRIPSYRGPFLPDGARVRTAQVGPELEDALADGVNVLDAIDPQDAATIVIELSRGARGHGEDISRSIRANNALSAVFARTLKPQLQALYDFDVIFGALQDKGVDLNRLADAVNQGVPVYASPQAQRDLRRALDAVTPFANNLADLVILNRSDWDRLTDSGDIVLGAIAARPDGLHDLVHGLYGYVLKLGGEPYGLDDGSAAAGFVNFIGGDSMRQTLSQFCGAFPPEARKHVPVCSGGLP